MKKILVPTDFSECSSAAYSYAALLAEKTGAEICLLHILDIPNSNPVAATTPDNENQGDTLFMMEMMKMTKAKMKKLKNDVVFKGAVVTEVIEFGSISEKTFGAAKKYNADLIVMGTHGRNGLQETFLGSNAEKIVRDAEIPVLTVKDKVTNPKIENILLATDFSNEVDFVLPAVSRIADLLGSRLVLTKIVTPAGFESTHETEEQIEAFREKSELYNYSSQVYYAYNKEEGIRRMADTFGANMIALGTHGRHGLAHLFNGSIAEDLVNHSSVPVLTINFHKKLMKKKPISRPEKTPILRASEWAYQIPSV